MIKFEEHDDNLFLMLEEPVPLTDDAELPVLVRLIQDDTMLGKANKRSYHPDTLAKKIICSSRKLTDDGLFMDGNYTYCYEIIGTLVEEGSKEWALYQMMQGEKVCHEKSQSIMYCEHAGYIRREVRYNCVDHMSVSVWLDGADNTGWQIYEEPEPKYKAGDFVEIRNWYGDTTHLAQIDSIDHEIHIGSHRFDASGKSVMERLPQLSIIRKLKPSEVVVEIGCLSGTVRPVSTNGTHIWFHLISAYDETIATIRISSLDATTRSLVESLLKAQEEKQWISICFIPDMLYRKQMGKDTISQPKC